MAMLLFMGVLQCLPALR